ncbi:MAG: tetratricopeptide repeat protein [Acidobacteria bacterium]|nr:tetratricopeptide repeat protein [Acidobacteriota bacterium]
MLKAAFLVGLGFAFAQTRPDPANASARLQAAIQANPEIESNYTELGNLLLSVHDFPNAIIVLEHARQKFPRSPQASLSLGVAYYAMRRFPDAIGQFLDTSKLAPDIEQPVEFLSRSLEHTGARQDEVIACFQRFVKNQPNSAVGHYALGKAKGDVAELRRALALAPGLADAHLELGQLLEKTAKVSEAIREYERAASLSPKDPVPHYRLSRLYARQGKTALAEAARQRHQKLSAQENRPQENPR